MIKVITKEEILESRPKNLSVVPTNKKVSSPDPDCLYAIIGEGYGSLYKKIIFAVINDHNSVANNYQIFNTILNTTT